METVPDILGYRRDERGSLTPIRQPKGYIYTAAFIHCSECGTIISGMGGPKFNAICLNCYETVEGINNPTE